MCIRDRYNGVEKASAVKDKLIEMIHLNETLYCCGIACSSQGFRTKAGNYQIDLLLANVCKQNVTRFLSLIHIATATVVPHRW